MSDTAVSRDILEFVVAESDGDETVAFDGLGYFTIESRDTGGLLSAVLDDRFKTIL